MLQSQIRELEAENEQLKNAARSTQDPVEAPALVASLEQVPPKDAPSQEDTGIQDISVADLTQPEIASPSVPEVDSPDPNLLRLETENAVLRQNLESALENAALLSQEIENLWKISPETKKKIQDLQEQLDADDVTIAEPQKIGKSG